MRVLLDTQVLYIAASEGIAALPRKVAMLVSDSDTERCLSAASVMEIALKYSLGKSDLSEKLLRQGTVDLRLTIIPFTPQHAYRLYALPLHHRDPFDRMIIATALVEGIPMLGGDREFKKYKGLKVIW